MSDKISNIADINVLINTLNKEIKETNLTSRSILEHSKTNSYWKIGKLIHEHTSYHPAEYASTIINALTDKINLGRRNLYHAVQFYSTYPDKQKIQDRITWSHFRILTTVRTVERRKYYENLIQTEKITVKQLLELVKNERIKNKTYSNNLTIIPGIPNLYKVKQDEDELVIDLGFYISHALPNHNIKPGTNVLIKGTYPDYTIIPTTYDDAYLYTYKARITRIIDGDTLKVKIYQDFNTRTIQTLRLRGINTPAINSESGQKARDFLIKKLTNANIAIKTYSRDRYTRFLADIYYHKTETDTEKIITTGTFLNQQLLDEKLAVKYYRY